MKQVAPRLATPTSREVYYFSEICAAEGSGTCEDAAKAFQEACQSDIDNELGFTPPPPSGSKILMREHDHKNGLETDWFSVVVP